MESQVHTLSEAGAEGIRKTIDAATSDPTTQIPGCVFVAVNRAGEELISHASGRMSVDTPTPMTLDSVFWIASCTKMITGIACMQLVEQGKLTLDDAELVEGILPEVKRAVVFTGFDEKTGVPGVRKKETGITLKMLLTHTAGFAYPLFYSEARKLTLPVGIEEWARRLEDIEGPLMYEPGTRWSYGTGVDWAGVLVERISGLSLEEYFQKHIFEPLGIKNITMFPSATMRANLVHMHQRYSDGKIKTRGHIQRGPLNHSSSDGIFNSGGGGCFAQPQEYPKIIATLLNNGTSPHTGIQILNPATVDLMFTNHIPEMPNFAREPIEAAMPELTNPIAELYPQPHDQPQGWGLTFMLTISEGASGRGRNTGWWAGLSNLYWWCDRERGVGGIIASQILPFADPQVLSLWAQVEAAVYQG